MRSKHNLKAWLMQPWLIAKQVFIFNCDCIFLFVKRVVVVCISSSNCGNLQQLSVYQRTGKLYYEFGATSYCVFQVQLALQVSWAAAAKLLILYAISGAEGVIWNAQLLLSTWAETSSALPIRITRHVGSPYCQLDLKHTIVIAAVVLYLSEIGKN